MRFDFLQLPCKNAPYGCEEKVPLVLRRQHEAACMYRNLKCCDIYKDCSFSGVFGLNSESRGFFWTSRCQ